MSFCLLCFVSFKIVFLGTLPSHAESRLYKYGQNVGKYCKRLLRMTTWNDNKKLDLVKLSWHRIHTMPLTDANAKKLYLQFI
jgi:hypothetical protein